jgi:hypothetical protein
MLRRSASLVAALAVLVGASATGCSGGEPAASGSTTSVAPSVSASPGSPSPMPTEVADGTLDQNVLAQAITQNLNDTLGAGIELDVSCPAGVVIQQGATSTCNAVLDGQQLEFTVTQADAEGNVDFAPTSAVLDVAKLQTETAQQFGAQKGGTWSADCGAAGRAYLVQPVGATFGCTFTSSTGDTSPFTVTVSDLDGNISWSEN